MVRDIVQGLAGTISLQSDEGLGTTVTVNCRASSETWRAARRRRALSRREARRDQSVHVWESSGVLDEARETDVREGMREQLIDDRERHGRHVRPHADRLHTCVGERTDATSTWVSYP